MKLFLNLGQGLGGDVFLKRDLIWSYGDPPVQWSGTMYAIFKAGIIGNIHVKLYEFRTSGAGGDVVLRKSLRRTDHNTSPRAIGSGELKKSTTTN